jgi:hypothetical protein
MAVFSGAAFTFGVERHLIDVIPVRVYSAAKTIADCFKFRNKVWAAAKVCRVTSVIRPYLEAM